MQKKQHKSHKIKEYSAGYVVFYKDSAGQPHYLILHYPGGHFDFAKGHLEKNETELQAARRELFEETGLDKIKHIEGFKDEIRYTFSKRGQLVSKKVTFFLAKVSQSESQITISHEHQGSIWLNFDDSLKKVTFANARAVLIKAQNYLTGNF